MLMMHVEIRGKPRKKLPVDVREEDGLLTRTYVQDICADSRILIYLDRPDDSLQVLSPDEVFEPRDIRPQRSQDQYSPHFPEFSQTSEKCG